MNDQLQLKLIEIITQIQASVRSGSDFVLTQLPDIVQQYILYGRIYSTAAVALWVILFCVALFTTLKFGFFSKAVTEYDSWTDSRVVISCVGAILTFITFCTAISWFNSCMLAWLAPKIWLLKEFIHMVK